MPSFQIAHLNKNGVDMIIVPLSSSFGGKPPNDQRATVSELQRRSQAAGLKGGVVPVWETGNGGMGFIAPPTWHPFFRSIDLSYVWSNVNRQLSW